MHLIRRISECNVYKSVKNKQGLTKRTVIEKNISSTVLHQQFKIPSRDSRARMSLAVKGKANNLNSMSHSIVNRGSGFLQDWYFFKWDLKFSCVPFFISITVLSPAF